MTIESQAEFSGSNAQSAGRRIDIQHIYITVRGTETLCFLSPPLSSYYCDPVYSEFIITRQESHVQKDV